jgi:superfamily II DNA or RNA helicase
VATLKILYDSGTLVLQGFSGEHVPEGFVYDPRVGLYRGPAICYRALITKLYRAGVEVVDEAKAYLPLERSHRSDREPRPYQLEAINAWVTAGRRGIVVLPTGAGKSFVAELCIAHCDRSCLVVAPTLNLVGQWYDQLSRAFPGEVGVLGGGVHTVEGITVATYDSAHLHVERYGARFGLLIFDEIHHLAGPTVRAAAEFSLAPFRLGLTATLERPDGGHEALFDLVGPVVYRKEIDELSGTYLADYESVCLTVHLEEAERVAYEEARALYREFVEIRGIRMGGAGGWRRFLRETSRSKEGRRAFKAWAESRRLLQATPAKLRLLEELIRRHSEGRIIIFTNDNATVYAISKRMLVPAITHQTALPERQQVLADFASGLLPVLVTSRVLNEGIDIPSADVAIVLSGTSTVREHVQRLGRILRPQPGKRAVLYELVVADSVEERTSSYRRQHRAFQEE